MDSGRLVIDPPTSELWLPEAVKVINASSTPHDYCKRLTNHPILGDGMVGNHLFLLDNSGAFILIGGFGIYPYDEDQVFTQFDDQVFANAVGAGRFRRVSDVAGYDVAVSPALKADVPIGGLMSVFKPGQGGAESFEVRGFQELSYYLALGIYLSSAGFSAAASKRSPSGGKLNERQMQILTGIAEEKTNMTIAKELILSESSIKQETVKIFRILGVANRREAAQKAIAMGLVPEALKPNRL